MTSEPSFEGGKCKDMKRWVCVCVYACILNQVLPKGFKEGEEWTESPTYIQMKAFNPTGFCIMKLAGIQVVWRVISRVQTVYADITSTMPLKETA